MAAEERVSDLEDRYKLSNLKNKEEKNASLACGLNYIISVPEKEVTLHQRRYTNKFMKMLHIIHHQGNAN